MLRQVRSVQNTLMQTMKASFSILRLTSVVTAAWILSAGLSSGQTLTRYQSQFGGSKVRIEGTSTIHDWHAEGTLIGGSLELDAAFPLDGSAKPGKVAARTEVNIPVRSLKCSSGAAMDSVMQTAMNEEKHPRITFKLTELTLKEVKAGEPMKFDGKGELTVSGTKKEVTLAVLIQPLEGNKLKITGTTPLKMTEFGIQPPAPKAALGLIKTGDDVKIIFEWVTARAK
jgi:polyisoprenoid-binding protein YceI